MGANGYRLLVAVAAMVERYPQEVRAGQPPRAAPAAPPGRGPPPPPGRGGGALPPPMIPT